MNPSNTQAWYAALEKPFFAPPAWLFGPVWSVLYVLIALSFGYVFWQVLKGVWPKSIAVPFLLNLIANLLFSPIQFGLQSNLLASVDILIVLGTIVWMVRSVWKYNQLVALVQIPYALWVSFATVLQLTITWMNL